MNPGPRYRLEFDAEVWIWSGKGAWHFATLPPEIAQELKEVTQTRRRLLGSKLHRGWGAIAVHVCVGQSQWDTSVFPHARSRSYLLPLKGEIRKRERLGVGDTVHFALDVPMP